MNVTHVQYELHPPVAIYRLDERRRRVELAGITRIRVVRTVGLIGRIRRALVRRRRGRRCLAAIGGIAIDRERERSIATFAVIPAFPAVTIGEDRGGRRERDDERPQRL